MEYLLAILTGGVAVAVVEGIKEYLRWKRERKAKKEDREAVNLDSWRKQTDDKIDALVESQKFQLYYSIKTLGQKYIAEGEVDFDDRRILRQMHDSYHSGLNGNGDLDSLMEEVDKLPLKKETNQ